MTTSYHHFTPLKGRFVIALDRIENYKLVPFTTLEFKDTDFFDELPLNLGNYYSWAAVEIKKELKPHLTGLWRCSFFLVGERKATIVMNFNSKMETDGFLFQ